MPIKINSWISSWGSLGLLNKTPHQGCVFGQFYYKKVRLLWRYFSGFNKSQCTNSVVEIWLKLVHRNSRDIRKVVEGYSYSDPDFRCQGHSSIFFNRSLFSQTRVERYRKIRGTVPEIFDAFTCSIQPIVHNFPHFFCRTRVRRSYICKSFLKSVNNLRDP